MANLHPCFLGSKQKYEFYGLWKQKSFWFVQEQDGNFFVDVPGFISMFQSHYSSPRNSLCIFQRSPETSHLFQTQNGIRDSSKRQSEHVRNFPVFLVVYCSFPFQLFFFFLSRPWFSQTTLTPRNSIAVLHAGKYPTTQNSFNPSTPVTVWSRSN